MKFIFPYIGNFIIPTDELIFFRGVGSTINQYGMGSMPMVATTAGSLLCRFGHKRMSIVHESKWSTNDEQL